MAEIKIEKKTPIWPWILLGLIILAAILYFVFRGNDEAETVGVVEDTTQNVAITQETTHAAAGDNDAVNQFLTYINSEQSMGEDHQFTSEALIRLTRAVEAKAQQTGYNVEGDLSRVRQVSNEITQDASATTHANKISTAATTLADVMGNMQQAKFPNLNNQAQEVQQAANAIKPNVLTLEQKEPIRNFFQKSATLLQQMN